MNTNTLQTTTDPRTPKISFRQRVQRRLHGIMIETWILVDVFVRMKIAYFRTIAQNRFRPRKTVLFYPERPWTLHMVSIMCHRLGYAITTNPSASVDMTMYFKDITIAEPDPVIAQLSKKQHVFNAQCLDISKKHVEDIFQKVFGYGMIVDPRTATGTYVQKSDTNAMHDGKILNGPTEPKAGYIYQKLVDNIEGDRAIDLRAVIMNGTIPLMVRRFKPIHDRFDSTTETEIIAPEEYLSPEEIEKVLTFSKEMGLEYGELDMLRDTIDKRLYIVDANKTPWGPPRFHQFLGDAGYEIFIQKMMDGFVQNFF